MLSNGKCKILKSSFDQNPNQYLTTYIKIAYYLCAIPFRCDKIPVILNSDPLPKVPNARNAYIIKKWLPQQILCYVAYTWSLYKYIPSLYAIKLNSSKASSFDFVAVLTSFGVRISFIFCMITKQTDVLAIINFLSREKLHNRKTPGSLHRFFKNLKITWLVGLLTVCYCCRGVGYYIFGISTLGLSNWAPKKSWSIFAGKAKFNFFLSDSNESVVFEEITVAEHVGTSIFVLLQCVNIILSHFVGNGFLIFSMLFHRLASDFQSLMEPEQQKDDNDGSNEDDGAIIKRYWKLRYLINEKANKLYGTLLMWWMLEAVVYYSFYVDTIFNESDLLIQFQNVVYVFNFVTVLYLASDANHKIATMKEWIIARQHKQTFLESHRQLELIVILNTLSPCDVGMKAFGCFTISHHFIATITHVIITYAVILLNFGDEEHPLTFIGYSNVV